MELSKTQADRKDEKPKPSFWKRMKEKTAIALSIAGLAASGCVFNASGLESTGNTDSGTTEKDAGEQKDAGSGGMDGGLDADAGLDSGQGGQDSGTGGSDGGILDGGEDADAGPAQCPGATTGTWSGTLNKVTPAKSGGYSFLYKGEDVGGNALVDISCDSNSAPIATDLPCALNVSTDFDQPQDTKRITIHPTQIGAGAMVGSITVANHP